MTVDSNGTFSESVNGEERLTTRSFNHRLKSLTASVHLKASQKVEVKGIIFVVIKAFFVNCY